MFLCSFLPFSAGSHTILFIIQRRLGDSGELLSTEVLQSFAVKKYEKNVLGKIAKFPTYIHRLS